MLEAVSSTSEAEQFPTTSPSATHRDRRISELKRQVALGQYIVCSGELADKLLYALQRCDRIHLEEA